MKKRAAKKEPKKTPNINDLVKAVNVLTKRCELLKRRANLGTDHEDFSDW